MGRSFPLFLTRAAAIGLAGMLLFAVFGRAHAADDDNYGLKRFSGDNYDSVPPGAGIPAPPAPAGFTPVPSGAPAGYYPALNGGVTPQVTVSPPPVYQQPQAYQPPQPYAPQPSYQPAPTSTAPYGYKPVPGEAPASQVPAAAPTSEAYGYKPVMPTAPTYPAPRMAEASPMRGDPYAYYQQGNGDSARANAEYVLGPGDKLHLNVFGETDLSGDFTIDGSGTVRLPLIGQVRAAGYTGPQLEQAIGAALAQGYLKSPRVAVEVATYRPFYIIGAVNRPGQYPYIDHMNALNAVALAGGFLPSAVESVVFLRREGSNEEVEVPADRTTQIHPGDVVKVHNTFFSDVVNIVAPFSGVAASAATAAVIQ
jgi:protein involved in polysaccharide export with SLBB domain